MPQQLDPNGTPRRIPTTEKLARALEDAGAPQWMIANAREGRYDEYKSQLAFPITQLVTDARNNGLSSIAMDAIDGKFNARKWKADQWAKSPNGQATFDELFKDIGQ